LVELYTKKVSLHKPEDNPQYFE
jgi:hypothetical protein